MFGLFRQLDLFDIPWLCDNHAVLMSNANALQCCNSTKELLLLYPTQVVTADRPSAHLSAADDSEKKTKLHSRMNDRHQFPARPDPPSLAFSAILHSSFISQIMRACWEMYVAVSLPFPRQIPSPGLLCRSHSYRYGDGMSFAVKYDESSGAVCKEASVRI